MKRNLIAAIALLAANAAFATPMLPGDLDGDWKRLQGAPEATSYVADERQSLDRTPVFEFIPGDQPRILEFVL
jgi:hypothetical protein